MTAERTDLWNAERLVEAHSSQLRFVGTWGKGLVWDGRRWCLDDTGLWRQYAHETVRDLLKSAFDELRSAQAANNPGAIAKAAKNVEHAIKSQASKSIAALLVEARVLREVAVSHLQLDEDPWLLNVANGTIDLHSGGLRSHRRSDLITKIAPVVFDPMAKAPTWSRFLERSLGSQEMVRYVQKLVGYSLTGSTQEQLLVLNFGAGRNGKSTFTGTIHALLGDYAAMAPRKLMFKTRGSERHETELTVLHGKRFVTCSEIEEGQAFDEPTVKDLTGSDPITARRMRENHWEFTPSHKLWLNINHKPVVHGTDEGIWRRMRLLPWTHSIPLQEVDKDLAVKLRAELSGILTWAVEGCLAWQREGLIGPEAVLAATHQYRAESDVLGEFFRVNVIFDREAAVSRRVIRTKYEEHCKENGAEPLGARRFAGRLRERGCTDTCVRLKTPPFTPIDGWRGVRLMTDREKVMALHGMALVPDPAVDDEPAADAVEAEG